MDVLDLDFSPRDILASASIDNRILLWDMNQKQPVMSPFRILHQHSSFVKGISFDPIGKYLVSCGTDNKVILWECNSWEVEITLTEPMKHTADKSMFRRMTWSPDGASLCLSSATKSSKPIGVVLRRGTWEATADLVGHDTQSTCCRFCPTVLTTVDAHKRPLCVVGLADQTGVLSIWSTAKTAPLLVLRECFDEAVTDITWDREGRGIMVACSVDGSITIIDNINPGIPMKEDHLDKHFRALYGRGAKEASKQQTPLTQNALSLKYSGKFDVDEDRNGHDSVVNAGAELAVDPPPAPVVYTPQVVSVTKDGKKRVAPMLMTGGGNISSIPATTMNSTTLLPGNSSSTGSNLNNMASGMLGSVPSSSTTTLAAKRPRVDGGESTSSLVKITLNRNEMSVSMPVYPKNTNRTIEYIVSPSFNRLNNVNTNNSGSSYSVLRAMHVIPPREISQPQLGPAIPFHSSCLTSVSMVKGSRLRIDNDEVNDDSILWKTSIAGQATCIAGQGSNHPNDDHNDIDDCGETVLMGLCIVGCSDGTLHILSIDAGVRVSPPLVLGAAIASLELKDNNLLALTADGELWKWEVKKICKNGSTFVNDEILACTLRTNVRPVILAVKSKIMMDSFHDENGNDQLVSATIERCYMQPTNGLPVVHIKTSARGGVGGDLQMFCYSPSSQAWMRLADMRYVLSSATRQPSTKSIAGLCTYGNDDKHFDALQDEANRNAGISSHAVATLSRPVTSHDTGNNLRQYLEGITLSHTEERLSLACTIGNRADIYHWLSEWVKVCCRHETTKEKVKWVVNELMRSDMAHLPFTKQLLGLDTPKDIIDNCVLPAIAADGMSENLLEDVHQTVSFLTA